MTNVLTLIADARRRGLDDSMIATAREALAATGAAPAADTAWLAPGIACDVTFTGGTDVQAAVAGRLAGADVDVVAQPIEGRRKTLLVADMESTIIANEFVDELAELAGVGARVAAISERAMAGELEFEPALIERVAMLAGLSDGALERVYENLTVMPGAHSLVATMRAHGAHAALVSGGFTCFSERVCAALGFNSHSANTLELAARQLSGKLIPPIIDRAGKRRRMDELCGDLGIGRDQAMAVGDAANDIDMLEAAGMGVAFYAKPGAAEAARVRIEHGDLTALLYIQGYHARDIRLS